MIVPPGRALWNVFGNGRAVMLRHRILRGAPGFVLLVDLAEVYLEEVLLDQIIEVPESPESCATKPRLYQTRPVPHVRLRAPCPDLCVD